MQEKLIARLHYYLTNNHPDLIINLQEKGKLTDYLNNKIATLGVLEELIAEGKPVYIIEEICLEALTRDLRPSKFNYLLSILQEEFESYYREFEEDSILTYEVINMIAACKTVFEAFGFTEETEDNRHLKYAIIGEIDRYLKSY